MAMRWTAPAPGPIEDWRFDEVEVAQVGGVGEAQLGAVVLAGSLVPAGFSFGLDGHVLTGHGLHDVRRGRLLVGHHVAVPWPALSALEAPIADSLSRCRACINFSRQDVETSVWLLWLWDWTCR